MNIFDIIPDFSKLSEEQIREKIAEARRSRTIRKEVSVKARPTKEASKAKASVTNDLKKLSADDLSLLKALLKS